MKESGIPAGKKWFEACKTNNKAMEKSKAKIFLNEERGLHETEWCRSFRIFNFDDYFNEHKAPFRNLYIFNDEVLAGGQSLRMNVGEDSFVILLPVTGAIKINDEQSEGELIHAGQARIFNTAKDSYIEIANPYETELVNFLQIWIKEKPEVALPHTGVANFNLKDNKDKLVAITPGKENASMGPFCCVIGKFAGRTDVLYKLTNVQAGVFVYIIEGAFEVQNRLLHAKDGLALWDLSMLEAEALSNDAILLIIELPDYG